MELPKRYLRAGQRFAGRAENAARKAAMPLRSYGFPYRAPNVPKGVEVPEEPSKLGADYDTEWARRPLARAARGVITEGPLRLLIGGVAMPDITGLDRLDSLSKLEEPPPVIFAPNHHSHLDTGLMISAIPRCWRRELVVAAAADYFFDSHWKAAMSALALNAIPIDREVTSRKSSDMFRDLIADGHSLLIYPEGGRSPDGWGQEFKGGAAYLSARTGAPVVPVFIDGTGAIYGKGMKRPKPGRTKVVFGAPLRQADDENTRRFNSRIEAAVTRLGDEALTDYWTATKRAAQGTNPALTGPEYNGWRRQWELGERRKLGAAGLRRRQKRVWPDLG
ncbi:1-acyl-sn-glycerol-3-phosphate acyltransferase [Ilumatobacter fluminis]|uniref:1-acyl-sn-glycerol-3-phosphate acyltransferase n=1 Tax=Ilumatobacter fluminis TaxID=467091 RepID=A0A4R7I2E0_9ACTN|nr:lysophospholipid acyltransferase family protein [Ilumatobacter fluminis]TDT16796.1 1-acyl-sn-glycerol-3-phosphate acyltransferase [Ilumatobacter fluminis]